MQAIQKTVSGHTVVMWASEGIKSAGYIHLSTTPEYKYLEGKWLPDGKIVELLGADVDDLTYFNLVEVK